jgi:alpha-L-fucosidase
MDGKGDVIKMLSAACQKQGIEMGVYISPWDRNHPDYGTPKYNDIYINTMKELLTGYGPFFELWWDGANGEGPNGKKQVYDFTRFKDSALKYQPQLIIFSDIGPHARWVGNENGIIGETNWNLLDTAGFKPGEGAPNRDTLNRGNYNGKNWIGAEADVSIRKGWFYHKEEDETVKSGSELFNLYFNSVGHGGNMLLNVPPNRKGLIDPLDSAALMDFKRVRENAFRKNILSNAKIIKTKNAIEIQLLNGSPINTIVLKEDISKGQRVVKFEVSGSNDLKQFQTIAKGSTIGHKRIIQFHTQNFKYYRVKITESKASPIISAVEGYLVTGQ